VLLESDKESGGDSGSGYVYVCVYVCGEERGLSLDGRMRVAR